LLGITALGAHLVVFSERVSNRYSTLCAAVIIDEKQLLFGSKMFLFTIIILTYISCYCVNVLSIQCVEKK